MGIDAPSDGFYTINTNQSGPPMSARHKLQPRLLRSNPTPNTFPKKQTRQKWTGSIYVPGQFINSLVKRPKMLYRNSPYGLYTCNTLLHVTFLPG